MRILLVEDHADSAKPFARLFEKSGALVTCVASIEEARLAFVPGDFDVILCDLVLPDGDGCDLMRQLKGRSGLPGVAITGNGRPGERERSRRAGFDAHVTKPASIDDLWWAIRIAMEVRVAVGRDSGHAITDESGRIVAGGISLAERPVSDRTANVADSCG